MKRIKYTLLALWLLTTVAAISQSKNPYKSIGKKSETLTLTKGRYEELFDQDSIQQIGTALINVHTLKVVKLLEENEAKERLQNEKQSRFLSIDPLAKSFPWNSPYSYAENDVIRSIDLDGLEKYVVTYWYDNHNNHRKTTIRAIRAQDTSEVMDLTFSSANGGDLTNKDVWVRKLYLDGRQKAAGQGKKTLDASEKALFGKAVSQREKDLKTYPEIFYDLGDEKGGATTVSENFPSTDFEYRMAEKNIPIVQNLQTQFDNATFFYAFPSGQGRLLPKNEAIGIDKDVKEFFDLPSKIKEDGGIKSVNITLTYYVSSNLNDKDFNGLKQAYGQVANQIKEMFLKSGVTNVNVNPVVERSSNAAQLNKNTPDVQINLKR